MNELDILGEQQQLSSFPQPVVSREPQPDPEAYKADQQQLVSRLVSGQVDPGGAYDYFVNNTVNYIPPQALMGHAQAINQGVANGKAPKTPEQAAEAALVTAAAKTAQATDQYKQMGPQAFLQQQMQMLQGNSGGVASDADRVWLNTLMRTGSFDQAGSAYVDVYKTGLNKMIEGQNQLAVKFADEQIKKGQALEAINNIKINTLSSLLKYRPGNVTQQQAQDWASQIANASYLAKEKPEVASLNLKQVVDQMKTAGYTEQAIINSGAAEALKLSPEQEKQLAPILQYMKPELVARLRLNDGLMDEEITKDMERAQRKLNDRIAREKGQVAGSEAAARESVETQYAGQKAAARAAAEQPYKQAELTFKNNLELTTAGKREYNQQLGKQVAESLGTEAANQATIDKYTKAITIINSGKHSIGPLVSGATIARPIGSAVGTEAAGNTKDVQAAITALAAEGLKQYGANPSNVDLKVHFENKPDVGRDSPERIKEWLDSGVAKIAAQAQATRAQAGELGITNIPPAPSAPNPNKPKNEGVAEGTRSTSKSGKPIIFRNGKWEYL